MDEQNKYLEDTKSLIEKKIQLKEPVHCEDLIKDVKEECILYDSAPNFLEENRDEFCTNFNDISKQKLSSILTEISSLSSKEKLLLYFKIPGGITESDPLRQHQNPLGTRLEINRTINWIKSHLEHDPEVSIPKQDVYNDYSVFCKNASFKPLSTADFGKVMKQVFPDVKPRRLGTRGNSRYCYAAMRKVTKLVPPHISVMDSNTQKNEFFEEIDKDSWSAIKKWTEEVMHVSFDSIKDLATYIKKNNLNALNPSKIILQRKYMQRYNNKKKFSDLNIKRKKKRKRKNSNVDTVVPACISPITLKVEEFSDSNNSFNSCAVLTPMNLAMENTDFHKSNSDIFNDSEISNGLKENNVTSTISCKSLMPTPADTFDTKIKENRNEDLTINSTSSVAELLTNKNSTSITNHNLLQRSDDNSLMGPPQVQPNSEIYANSLNLRKRLIMEAYMNRNLNKGLNLNNSNESDNVTEDKDVLLQNLGLPRERVISICNMDKHELDDYLPNIENPDEQDAELLQYFQAPEPPVTKSEGNTSQISTGNKNDATITISTMFNNDSLPQQKCDSNFDTFTLNKNVNLTKKDLNLKSIPYCSDNCVTGKTSSTIYARESETPVNIYATPTPILEQRNFKINSSYTSSSKSRYNFVPISTKTNTTLNIRPTMNLHNSCAQYNIKMYNPTISASAPTSPNILRQRNVPCYQFDVNKYEISNIQNFMESNNNDNLEYRSRSVPLNGPKIEEFDNSEYMSECNSIAQTPIPHEFNDFSDQILLNDPETLDITINPLRTSQQNIYIPQMNNDLQNNMSKKMYENVAEKYAINKSTISRSNPTTPSPLISLQKNPSAINNFEIKSIQQSNKMFDLSKSMPTTPIESEMNMFRYSPEMKSNSLIGAGSGVNRNDFKKRRNISSFNQYKDSNHSIIGTNQSTNLENSLSNFDVDPGNEILKNL